MIIFLLFILALSKRNRDVYVPKTTLGTLFYTYRDYLNILLFFFFFPSTEKGKQVT